MQPASRGRVVEALACAHRRGRTGPGGQAHAAGGTSKRGVCTALLRAEGNAVDSGKTRLSPGRRQTKWLGKVLGTQDNMGSQRTDRGDARERGCGKYKPNSRGGDRWLGLRRQPQQHKCAAPLSAGRHCTGRSPSSEQARQGHSARGTRLMVQEKSQDREDK